MFSKACEYGIRAIIHIAHQSQKGNRVSLKEVAKAIDSPVAFTAKILQALAKDELIVSTKGANGGYEIPSDQLSKVSLRDVVKSIDGDNIYNGCGLGLKGCNEKKPCPVHYQFKAVRDDLKKMLETTTIQDLALGLNQGIAFLKR
ncbi:MAG: Rrf2 family transcriptional regulator [Chitinophagales bacterium]|nr:Rrf2 family transcriptional regulator [Chitinophagales bacterium]